MWLSQAVYDIYEGYQDQTLMGLVTGSGDQVIGSKNSELSSSGQPVRDYVGKKSLAD